MWSASSVKFWRIFVRMSLSEKVSIPQLVYWQGLSHRRQNCPNHQIVLTW